MRKKFGHDIDLRSRQLVVNDLVEIFEYFEIEVYQSQNINRLLENWLKKYKNVCKSISKNSPSVSKFCAEIDSIFDIRKNGKADPVERRKKSRLESFGRQ